MNVPSLNSETPEASYLLGAVAAERLAFLPVEHNSPAMNGETLRRPVTVQNPMGLHMRPLTAFAQRAGKFQSSVIVVKDGQRVNGKSPLELMLLAAEQGTKLLLEVSGSDAVQAIDVLAELLGAPSVDDETPPPPPKG
jgi:phosphocarrier protein HPr